MNRQPHAVVDLSSRYLKAQKIERLLGLNQVFKPIRLLDIGTGSGGIAHYFATQADGVYNVTGVDVVDVRIVKDGYSFCLLSDTNLPFPDGCFDVVISNHVIEHVGDSENQINHLKEILRVMARKGVAYLATPNRWMLVEPHYGLPFLSWLPHSMWHRYVRAMRRGNWYDCEPLSPGLLEDFLCQVGFQYENICIEALMEMFRTEKASHPVWKLLSGIPKCALRKMLPWMPTLVYKLRPIE
ncbi:MAG: class I SAM-dependent methyltransferase [Desulfosoma sp.]